MQEAVEYIDPFDGLSALSADSLASTARPSEEAVVSTRLRSLILQLTDVALRKDADGLVSVCELLLQLFTPPAAEEASRAEDTSPGGPRSLITAEPHTVRQAGRDLQTAAAADGRQALHSTSATTASLASSASSTSTASPSAVVLDMTPVPPQRRGSATTPTAEGAGRDRVAGTGTASGGEAAGPAEASGGAAGQTGRGSTAARVAGGGPSGRASAATAAADQVALLAERASYFVGAHGLLPVVSELKEVGRGRGQGRGRGRGRGCGCG